MKPKNTDGPLNVIVVGASGDLARRKIFPALFALYSQDLLPEDTHFFGFARSTLEDDDFREQIAERLTCRYTPEHDCDRRMREFLERCHYVSGQYASRNSFLDLYMRMQSLRPAQEVNQLFYLAIPPSIFLDVARAIGGAGMVRCTSRHPWSRVVIEKPFGRDRGSSDLLASEMKKVFAEFQTYRIDHYLGKEVIQNLLVLRFANLVFEPIWNRKYIESVSIAWAETLGVEGRGGYFDEYGIIRDVMQNHLLQILALTAMDPPQRVTARAIRDQKVALLRSVRPVRREDLVVGQYRAGEKRAEPQAAYVDDPKVADDSITPTYAAAVLHVDNDRWQGVPFFLTAGKALERHINQVRIRFRTPPENMFCELGDCPEPNELVIRIQPDEAVYLQITNKTPGLGLKWQPTRLDLQYQSAFEAHIIPDAYENLLMDVVRGEESLFIRNDELAAAWDVFTPVLHELEEKSIRPDAYPAGSEGPKAAQALAARCGVPWS